MNAVATQYTFTPTPVADRDLLVARTAQEAQAAGTPMIKAVAARLDISYNAAKESIKRARQRGYCIPYKQPTQAVRPTKHHTKLAACALVCDCGHRIELTEQYPGDMLRTHTLATHGRLPHLDERTPRRKAPR